MGGETKSNTNWRLQDFGSGGESRGNGSEGANAGGPGGEGPPDASEVSFFKTIQSIRKWIHFSKIEHIFLPENPFFSKKNSKIGHISQEFLSFFLKKYLKFFLEELYNSWEIPDELYYLVETYIKKANKWLSRAHRRGSGGRRPPGW